MGTSDRKVMTFWFKVVVFHMILDNVKSKADLLTLGSGFLKVSSGYFKLEGTHFLTYR